MPPIRLLRRIGVRPLAARLLVYVLLFSVILSLAATGVQLIGEFDRRTAELRNTQQRAAELVSGAMRYNLWLMNYSEVANSLDDMRAIPVIQHARVISATGEEFNTGTYPEGRVISQSFPLVFDRTSFDMPNNNPEAMGTLTVTSSVETVYNQLMDRALLTLLFQSMIVMLGTLGLLVIVRLTLSRHLETISDYAARLNLDALIEPLQLQRKPPRRGDELSELEQALKNQGIRAVADLRNEKIGYKIREHTLQRIPYMLVIGQRELETGAVAVRTRDGQDLGSRPFEEVAAGLAEEDASHGRFVLEGS